MAPFFPDTVYVQPVKELSSAAGLCAGRGCALIRKLANLQLRDNKPTEALYFTTNVLGISENSTKSHSSPRELQMRSC